VTRLAIEILGDEDKAMAWLNHEQRLLGGRKPIDVARTLAGARLIENILARISWGASL
jgi:putative toxin-antitoxin system antitoxin component (TIGR02293 family)